MLARDTSPELDPQLYQILSSYTKAYRSYDARIYRSYDARMSSTHKKKNKLINGR